MITLTEEEFEDLNGRQCGICLACGYRQYGCEPDARKYTCEECEQPKVYGIEELLMMGKIEFGKEDGEV